jgi:2-haloacid dehalogenase
MNNAAAIEATSIKAIVFDAYGTLYDVQSVESVTNAAFPGYGAFITQIWRLKQLEYTWLRSMMGKYEDFWTITREALAFTIETLGLHAESTLFEKIAEAYNTLAPYPDAEMALRSLSSYHLAILSNGSPPMLRALVRNSGFESLIKTVISVDAKKVFKPDPSAYELVEEETGFTPDNVLFVSSNGFDISGARSFGFRVARIERVTPAALRAELADAERIGPARMFKALRAQAEHLGFPPDFVVNSLGDLPALAARGFPLPHGIGKGQIREGRPQD